MPDKIDWDTGFNVSPDTGSKGEQEAARFLEENGYEILERNFRAAGSEVDLIAKNEDTLCFVEVKTRAGEDYGMPEEFVDRRKRQKIVRAARIYAAQDKFQDCYIRFDIIALLHDGDERPGMRVKHIPHAFEVNN